MNWFIDGLRFICAWVCEIIYMLIASLYQLFMNISRVELLTSDQIHPIYQRITMILTIVMVFYVTFETVKFVIQPDQFSDKEKGASKIVVRMVLVVLLIAFVPQIFTGAYWVQNKIFDTQVFSKVILGKQNVNSDEFGRILSYNILSMFYSLDTESFDEEELEKGDCGNSSIPCKQLVLMNYHQLQTEGKVQFLTEGLDAYGETEDKNTGETINKYYINFNAIFALGVGAFIVYMLLLYCIDAGVRVVQLLFLQIIAPIPIMAYLSPKKDGMFEKWTKQCLTTYLDLFIRVGIIYFILLICQILGNAYKNGTLVNNVSSDGAWLIYIALIMGLLLFAHKMPKMLQELFPKMGAASGNFGLKATERVAPEAARAIGAGLGGVNRLVKGGAARMANTRRRNQEIREKRRAAGKDTSWRAVNQERIQADKDARHAKRQNRQAQRAYNQEQRATRSERNAVLAAEKELAEAKRSGNAQKIDEASKKLERAQRAQENKRASLQANQDLDKAKKERDRLIASGASAADIQKASDNVKTAQSKVDAINSQQHNHNIVHGEESQNRMKEKNDAVTNIENDRAVKQAAVETAEKELAAANASGNPTAIADAQSKLANAMQARDGNLDIYNQEQTIKASEAEISKKQSEIGRNNQMVSDAEAKHATATSAVNTAQSKLNDVTIQGDKDIAAAQAVLNNVQSNAKVERDKINNNPNLTQKEKAEQLAVLSKQEEVATEALAKAQVNKGIAVSKAQTELNNAQNNATQTQNALNAAKNTRDSNNASLESEIKAAEKMKTAAQQAKESSEKLRDSDYERAKQERDAYKKHLTKHEEKLTDSNTVVAEYTDRVKTNYEKSQAEYAKAQSDVAEISNERYRSPVVSGTAGAIGGAWRGATTGFKATKLEDIGKQVKEGAKKDREAIAAHEKWLDSGGTTITSQVASSIKKNVGVMTEAQVYEMQIKNYENQISTQKRLGAIEGSAKTNVDNAKSRSGSKITAGEQKTKVSELDLATLTYKDSSGNEHRLIEDSPKAENGKPKYAGMTTSAIYEAESNAAKAAREKAQAARQAATTARAQGSANASQLEIEADNAAQDATSKEQLLGQKKKALEEYAITHVLRTEPSLRRNKAYEPDQVLVEQVENSLQSIEESKRNQDTYNRMMAMLPEKYKEAYRTGNIRDFDTLDTIQSTLTTIKGQRDREISTLETMSGILKASSQLDSAKAADGSSGK